MSEHWWRKRKKHPWFDAFDEFDRLEEMMRRTFEKPPERTKFRRPHIYGFSMSVGPDGKPVIREFGNIQAGWSPRIREERESLVDVMEEDKDVVIVAELPGVEKDDIKLHAAEDYLTISVDAPERGYHKELTLPARVNPQSARTSYKNGVLEVRLKKLVVETPIKS